MDFPEKMFSASTERSHLFRRINNSSTLRYLPDVAKAVGTEVWNHVRRSQLGVIVEFQEMKFQWSSSLLHYLLSRQLVCNKPHELWFLLGEQPARFSLLEFETITNMVCAEFPATKPLEDTEEIKRFWGLFNLNRGRMTPNTEDIARLCSDTHGVSSWSREDKIRLSYLAILSSGLLGNDRRTGIPFQKANLVMDLEFFEGYPWGRAACEDLVGEVKKATDKGRIYQASYVCNGFMQVLQVWAYVYMPFIGESCGHRIRTEGPYLLQYKGLSSLPHLDSYFSSGQVPFPNIYLCRQPADPESRIFFFFFLYITTVGPQTLSRSLPNNTLLLQLNRHNITWFT